MEMQLLSASGKVFKPDDANCWMRIVCGICSLFTFGADHFAVIPQFAMFFDRKGTFVFERALVVAFSSGTAVR